MTPTAMAGEKGAADWEQLHPEGDPRTHEKDDRLRNIQGGTGVKKVDDVHRFLQVVDVLDLSDCQLDDESLGRSLHTFQITLLASIDCSGWPLSLDMFSRSTSRTTSSHGESLC